MNFQLLGDFLYTAVPYFYLLLLVIHRYYFESQLLEFTLSDVLSCGNRKMRFLLWESL